MSIQVNFHENHPVFEKKTSGIDLVENCKLVIEGPNVSVGFFGSGDYNILKKENGKFFISYMNLGMMKISSRDKVAEFLSEYAAILNVSKQYVKEMTNGIIT